MRVLLVLTLLVPWLGGCGDGGDVHPGQVTQRRARQLVDQSRERLKDPALTGAPSPDAEPAPK